MKDSLHLTTDDKLVIVDISQDLLKLLDKSEQCLPSVILGACR